MGLYLCFVAGALFGLVSGMVLTCLMQVDRGDEDQ